MLVEIQSRFSKKKVELIYDVIAFGANTLFPDEDDVFINIQGIRKQGVYGDCMDEDDGEFTIRIDQSLSITDLITTVLHELVHVKQSLEGLEFDSDSPYFERWQEIEAHAMDKQLTEEYLAR